MGGILEAIGIGSSAAGSAGAAGGAAGAAGGAAATGAAGAAATGAAGAASAAPAALAGSAAGSAMGAGAGTSAGSAGGAAGAAPAAAGAAPGVAAAPGAAAGAAAPTGGSAAGSWLGLSSEMQTKLLSTAMQQMMRQAPDERGSAVRPLSPLGGGFDLPGMQDGGMIMPTSGQGLMPLSSGIAPPPKGSNLDMPAGGSLGQSGFLSNLVSGISTMIGGQAADTMTKPTSVTELPRMAEGGTVAPGGQAVVGEAGPEVATHTPAGTVISPIGRPEQAPSPGGLQEPKHVAGGVPPTAAPSVLDRVGGASADAMILMGAVSQGLPGIANLIQARRKSQLDANTALAESAIKNPSLLEISPTAVKAVDSMYGAGTAAGFLHGNDPAAHNRLVAGMFGIDLPQGPESATGPAGGVQVDVLTQDLQRKGIGFKIDTAGRIIPNVSSPSLTERSTAAAFTVFGESRENFVKSGMDRTEAAIMAANVSMAEMKRIGMAPPKEIVDMALASEQGEIKAAQAAMEKRAQLTQDIQGLEAERAKKIARAETVGKGQGTQDAAIDLAGNSIVLRVPVVGAVTEGEPTEHTIRLPVAGLEEMVKPITSPDTLNKFIMPDGSTPPPGTTSAQLVAMGAVPIDKERAQKLYDKAAVANVVNDLRTLRTELFTTDNVGARAQTGAKLLAAQYNMSSDQKYIRASQTIRNINGMMGFLARDLGGERSAVLSDRDIVRMFEAFSVSNMESATGLDVKLETADRGLSKLREGLIDGTFVPMIRSAGGSPEAVAKALGITEEFKSAEQARAQKRSGATTTTTTPGTTTTTTTQPGRPGQPLRGRAASTAVGGTLANLRRSLEAGVASGEITAAQAAKKYNAAEAAGLPAE